MSKMPYIQFYLGDYIKDTRILPLNIRGGWVDLILYMWENEPQGELTGTMDDFSRIMNCSIDEANLVIQTLKEKNIFGWEQVAEAKIKIVSRKQKKMKKLSETRKNVGKMGGNPKLVNQNLNQQDNQKDKLNTEYEYDNEIDTEYDIRRDRIGGMGEKKERSQLIPQMQEIWIAAFPFYTPDKELDFFALRTIADFIFKTANIKNGYGNNEQEIKVLNTFQLIADQVNREKFWLNKPLSSIAKNIQEFYNNIKNPINGTDSRSKVKSNGAATREELNKLYAERFGKK